MVENIIVRDKDAGSILELSQTETPYNILAEVDWGVIDAQHNTTSYVKQIGKTIVSTVLGTRDVTIQAWVIADSSQTMASRKQAINNFFNPLHEYDIVYNGYVLNVEFKQSVRWAREEKENNEIVCKWQIDGLAADPLFKEIAESSSATTESESLFKFPFKCTNGVDTTDLIFAEIRINGTIRVVNGGQADVGMIIKMRASGEVTNPYIENVQTGERITLDKVLHEGEVVEIDTRIGHKSVRGGMETATENYYGYRRYGSSWPQLAKGTNYYFISAEAGYDFLYAEVSFNRAYLEVQQCE